MAEETKHVDLELPLSPFIIARGRGVEGVSGAVGRRGPFKTEFLAISRVVPVHDE